MIDRVCIRVLDQAVQLIITPAGAVAVGRVLGLGHLLGGFLELAVQVNQ